MEQRLKNKAICVFAGMFLMTACIKGKWITDSTYRPKKPKFSILKQPFRNDSLLNNAYWYISTKKFINYDGRKIIGFMGFYGDGRMIIDNAWEEELIARLNTRNSFDSAAAIGYYTTNNHTVRVEYFIAGGGGEYITREGIVQQDTIIFLEKFAFSKEVRKDTFVRSGALLKN